LGIWTKYVVGMVASFSIFKDYSTFIKAAITVLSKVNDITFLCIGSGNSDVYKNSIPKKYKRNFLFLGAQNDVENIMSICNIGVLSSYNEGIPNTIMEFMALAKPVVVTSGGGIAELVEDEETGFIVSQSDSENLSKYILYLLENSDRAIKMGALGKTKINKQFSINKMIDAYYEEYQKICAE